VNRATSKLNGSERLTPIVYQEWAEERKPCAVMVARPALALSVYLPGAESAKEFESQF
jgi:hypothetical protein